MGRRGDRAVPIGRRRRLALLRRQGQGQDLFSAGLRRHAPAAGARRPRPVPASGVMRSGVRRSRLAPTSGPSSWSRRGAIVPGTDLGLRGLP